MMPGFILSIAVLGHQIADYIIITMISEKPMKKETSQHRVCTVAGAAFHGRPSSIAAAPKHPQVGRLSQKVDQEHVAGANHLYTP